MHNDCWCCTASNHYAYDYSNTDIGGWSTVLSYANNAWSRLGKSYGSYSGSNFTESIVRTNLPPMYGADAFYAFTHGKAGAFGVNGPGTTDVTKIVTASEVSTWREGNWYKLVFIDACESASDGTLASGFGITNTDGSLHAFLGWKIVVSNAAKYLDFDKYFWDYLSGMYRYSVGDSAYYAGLNTANWDYRIYGNPTTKY